MSTLCSIGYNSKERLVIFPNFGAREREKSLDCHLHNQSFIRIQVIVCASVNQSPCDQCVSNIASMCIGANDVALCTCIMSCDSH